MSNYLQERAVARVEDKWKKLENVEKELASQYRMAVEDIQTDISRLYAKYGKDNNLTYNEAVKRLNKVEIETYGSQMKRLRELAQTTGDKFYIAEMKKLESAVELTRLQSLVNKIDARLLDLGYNENVVVEEWLKDTYEDNYYRTLFEVQTSTTIGNSFTFINEKSIMDAITYPWSGSFFSENIWNNRELLAKELKRTITQGLIKGESFDKMAKRITEGVESGYKKALRVARTETSYVLSESTFKGYKESRVVEQYEYVAVLDKKTSKVCQDLDGEIVDLDKRKVGVNTNPMHPNCRSTTVAYLGKDPEALRAARADDGSTYYVPADMKYKAWYAKYGPKQ